MRNDVLELGSPLTDSKQSSKILDRYPLAIFTLKNVQNTLEAEEFDFLLYLLPYTLWVVAHTYPHLSNKTRKDLYEIALHIFMSYFQMTECEIHDRIKMKYCKEASASFLFRPVDLKKVINTICGHMSVLDIEIIMLALQRLTTYPTENHIGTIRLGSFFYHTGDNLLRVSSNGTIVH